MDYCGKYFSYRNSAQRLEPCMVPNTFFVANALEKRKIFFIPQPLSFLGVANIFQEAKNSDILSSDP
jgi:hypothetical protein